MSKYVYVCICMPGVDYLHHCVFHYSIMTYMYFGVRHWALHGYVRMGVPTSWPEVGIPACTCACSVWCCILIYI